MNHDRQRQCFFRKKIYIWNGAIPFENGNMLDGGPGQDILTPSYISIYCRFLDWQLKNEIGDVRFTFIEI